MKKLLFVFAAGLLTLTACGGSDSSDTKQLGAIIVTDTSGIEDKSFNQSSWTGMQKFTEETGVEVDHLVAPSQADYESTLKNAAAEEPKLVIGSGFTFATPITNVATQYPDQTFLLIDSVVEKDNVISAVFAEEQGSYLAGIAAGLTAKAANRSKLGFVGGQESDLIKKFEAGFVAGVKEVYPEATVMVEYAGDFTKPELGKSLANKLYTDGAYIIYHAAGGTGNGVFSEAVERRKAGEEVWVVGVDQDQYESGVYNDAGDSCTLTSMVKRADSAVYSVLTRINDGEELGGQVLEFDLANDGVGIPEKNPNLTSDITDTVKEYQDKIIAGDIVVPKK